MLAATLAAESASNNDAIIVVGGLALALLGIGATVLPIRHPVGQRLVGGLAYLGAAMAFLSLTRRGPLIILTGVVGSVLVGWFAWKERGHAQPNSPSEPRPWVASAERGPNWWQRRFGHSQELGLGVKMGPSVQAEKIPGPADAPDTSAVWDRLDPIDKPRVERAEARRDREGGSETRWEETRRGQDAEVRPSVAAAIAQVPTPSVRVDHGLPNWQLEVVEKPGEDDGIGFPWTEGLGIRAFSRNGDLRRVYLCRVALGDQTWTDDPSKVIFNSPSFLDDLPDVAEKAFLFHHSVPGWSPAIPAQLEDGDYGVAVEAAEGLGRLLVTTGQFTIKDGHLLTPPGYSMPDVRRVEDPTVYLRHNASGSDHQASISSLRRGEWSARDYELLLDRIPPQEGWRRSELVKLGSDAFEQGRRVQHEARIRQIQEKLREFIESADVRLHIIKEVALGHRLERPELEPFKPSGSPDIDRHHERMHHVRVEAAKTEPPYWQSGAFAWAAEVRKWLTENLEPQYPARFDHPVREKPKHPAPFDGPAEMVAWYDEIAVRQERLLTFISEVK